MGFRAGGRAKGRLAPVILILGPSCVCVYLNVGIVQESLKLCGVIIHVAQNLLVACSACFVRFYCRCGEFTLLCFHLRTQEKRLLTFQGFVLSFLLEREVSLQQISCLVANQDRASKTDGEALRKTPHGDSPFESLSRESLSGCVDVCMYGHHN